MSQVTIVFDHWPDKSLFPNKAGNTLHWAQRSALRKVAKEEAYYLCLEKKKEFRADDWYYIPFYPAKIKVVVTAKDRRKRDLDGFLSACKSWIDGIVEAGLLEDDNYFCVNEITIIFNAKIKEDTVSITITEAE